MAATRIQLLSLPVGTVQQKTLAGQLIAAPGATASVYLHDPASTLWGGANAPVLATVFAAEAGGGTLGQPLSADANGQLPGWVAQGQDLDVVATYGGVSSTAAQGEPEIASSVVSVDSPGPAPRVNGYDVFPSPADYLIKQVGTGVGAVNVKTGNTDYSVSSGDHAPVFQLAVNALANAGGPTGGKGGLVLFKGQALFQTQLILYPNIGLKGSAPISSGSGGGAGPNITSSFNGSIILCSGDSRSQSHIYVADFEIIGQNTQASQNGLEFNQSGFTDLKDVFVDNVNMTTIGKDGWVSTGSNIKVHAEKCFIESCVGYGINLSADTGNTLNFVNSYIAANTAGGINGGASFDVVIVGTRFTSNTGPGITFNSGTNAAVVSGCFFDSNGSVSTPQISIPAANNGGANIVINGNAFRSTVVTNQILAASSNGVKATIVGNGFFGQVGDAVAWTSRSANRLVIKGNYGYNDIRAKVTNPFSAAPAIGAAGTAAAPTASTTYKAEGADIRIVSTGGTGVSITITDPAANTVESGLATYSGILPIGYSVNFGAFSVAPTVYAGVV